MNSITPDRPPQAPLALRRVRAEALQPLLHRARSVLEHASAEYSLLSELEAPRKIAFCPAVDIGPGVECTEDLSALREINVVIANHVLEYLLQPRHWLLQLKDVLQPGGRLIALALYDRAGFRHPDRVKQQKHFFSWNVQTLGNLLIDCGCEFESGCVQRWPSPTQFNSWSRTFGPSAALSLARFFGAEFEVRIVARRPKA